MKYGAMPSDIMYDALVLLKKKLDATLLFGNMVLNKSPIWSTECML